MNFRGWLELKKNWPIYGLLLLIIPAFWWWRLWSGGTVLEWWRTQEADLAAPTFLKWEEFIALNSHQNEWPGRSGFYLILIMVVIFLLLRLAHVIRTDYRALLIVTGFIGFILLFSTCLCKSPEARNRKFCQFNLKRYYSALMNYSADFNQYPAFLPQENGENEKYCTGYLHLKGVDYCYPGADKKPGGPRFVVMEDAPHTHAGDLRHQLWSDGVIGIYYPWEKSEKSK